MFHRFGSYALVISGSFTMRRELKGRARSRRAIEDANPTSGRYLMKTVSDDEARADLHKMLEVSQHERVVITCDGKPRAILVGLSDYDVEDLELANSAEFWRMIEERRSGPTLSLAEVKARIDKREAKGLSQCD
jgi:prevent-host-death family protein